MNEQKNKNFPTIIAGLAIVIIVATIVILLGRSGPGLFNRDDDPVVATVNGIEILASDVVYAIRQVENRVAFEFFETLPPNDFDENTPFRGQTLGRVFREEAVRYAAMFALAEEYAYVNFGLQSTEESRRVDNDEIDDLLEHWGEELFNTMLEEEHITGRGHLERLFATWGVLDEMIELMLNSPEAFAPFEPYMESSDDGPSPEILFARAEALLERALAGEDFDLLIAQYGEDPGMRESPEGYTWAAGAMAPEFEEATRLLEIGGISPVVATSHGFHIVQRIEPNYDDIMRHWMVPEYDEEEILAAKHILIRLPIAVNQAEMKVAAIISGLHAMVDVADIVFLPALDDVPLDL